MPREKIPSDASPQVKELIERLYSSNEAVVATAASNLGGLESQATASIPFLIGILYDETRLEIVSGPFAKICSPTSVAPCPIRGEPTTVSRVAGRALAADGCASLPALDGCVHDRAT